jgi:hypothetical protein
MKKDNMLRFKPIGMLELMVHHGAIPKTGKNGKELKMHTFPGSLTTKVFTDMALNSIFTTMFADGRAMKKSEVISKAIPLMLAHFGNVDEESAERSILYAISLFTDTFPECGFAEFKLEAVA